MPPHIFGTTAFHHIAVNTLTTNQSIEIFSEIMVWNNNYTPCTFNVSFI